MKRRSAWALAAVVVVAPAWLLGTASGLHAVAALAERLTGGALSIRNIDGRLLGDVAVGEVTYRARAVTVRVERAEVNLRLSRLLLGRIQAERLRAQTLSVVTTATPRPAVEPRTPLRVSMPLRLAVEDGRIETFRLRLAGWTEDRMFSGTELAARWRDEWLVVGLLRTTTAEAGTVEARGRIAIVGDLLHLAGVEVSGHGTLRLDGALALGVEAHNTLELAWENLHLPGGVAPGYTSSHGSGRLDGPWANYAWQARAHLHLADVPGELDARGRGTPGSLTLQRGELKALDGVLRGEGRIDWTGALRTQLAVSFERLNPGSVWAAWPGALQGTAKLNAQWGTPTLLEFDGALRDSQLRGYPFALHATGRTEDRKVFLKEFALQSGASQLRAQGQLLPEMVLTGSLRSAELGALWAGLSGRAELQASVHGTFDAPRVAARGTFDDVVYQRYRVTHGALDAVLAPKGQSRLDLQLTELEVGVPLRAVAISGGGTRTAHRLRIDATGPDSSAMLAFAGGERGGAWRGQLVEGQVAPPQGARWTLEEPARLSYARGRFESEPACFGATDSRACAQLGFAPGQQHIAFRLHNFDLQHLRPWLPGEWNITGALSGTAALRLRNAELVELRSDLAGTAGVVEGGGMRMEFGPGSLHVAPDGDRLHARLHLQPAGGAVDGEVWISPGRDLLDRPMLGDLRLRLPDLAWLPVLSPEIAGAQGALTADLHVSGTPRSPGLHGQLHLTGGRVQLTTPGIELTNMTASFERGRNAPLLMRAQASSGEGVINVEGELKSLQPHLAGTLLIRGQNVLGFNRPDIRAWLSPDLTLTLEGRIARLTGELGVPRAEITPQELNQRGIGPSSDQVLVEPTAEEEAATAGAMQIETEVRIALGDDVRFDGLGLKTRLTGAITAFDDPGRSTRGRGELRLDGGRYKAYGQELQIETGRLIFSGGPVTDPAIDIRAIRKPREDIKVGLRARGTLDAPEFSLFSEPAMSQEEQLSWLVLGRSLSATLDGGQRSQLAGAAMSLGLTGGDYLAQQLAPRLGLDEVSVGAKPGETTDLARFTIGKYLSPKLFVSYGVGLFQPGHYFRMQYDVGKRFKLVGESGVQQGGDLLYSIER